MNNEIGVYMRHLSTKNRYYLPPRPEEDLLTQAYRTNRVVYTVCGTSYAPFPVPALFLAQTSQPYLTAVQPSIIQRVLVRVPLALAFGFDIEIEGGLGVAVDREFGSDQSRTVDLYKRVISTVCLCWEGGPGMHIETGRKRRDGSPG